MYSVKYVHQLKYPIVFDEFLMKSLKSASSFFPSSVKFSLTVASFCRF